MQLAAGIQSSSRAARLAVSLACVLALVAPPAAALLEPPRSPTAAVADLEALQRAFQQVVDQVAPSVVGIRATRHHVTLVPPTEPDGKPTPLEQDVVVNGSGTVLAADGVILTSEHVVQGATDIDVLFFDGQRQRAAVIAADARSDLAILQVPRSALRPATIGDWTAVARGQWSIVIGNPFGLGLDGQLSVSVGVIANLGRQLPGLGEVDDRFYNDMIQITAPINPGNSGGPLFNIRGELIGIVTAMHTRAPADEGIGFAIPLTPLKQRLIETLRQGRAIHYGYLGLTVRAPNAAERVILGVGRGAVVEQIEPDGPAALAGIAVGDLVVGYERQTITGPAQLAELVGQSPVGAAVQIDLLRGGQPLTVQATVERRELSRVSWMRSGAVQWRGMRLADLTDEARRLLRVDAAAEGIVVIEVSADGPAERANFRIGEVITEVDGTPIRDTLEFLLRVRAAQGALPVTVRNAGVRTVAP
ncbi:MAG TPA: trypsin-like peptidase domain-containing protein [Phycisphaerae bacterium]|nr:trypsin-like peptidase domain-containing protein [Phycisphaerae bacterium]